MLKIKLNNNRVVDVTDKALVNFPNFWADYNRENLYILKIHLSTILLYSFLSNEVKDFCLSKSCKCYILVCFNEFVTNALKL